MNQVQGLAQTNLLHRYRRNVHYYETDTMGVVHHSNYLRIFEEARVDWLRQNRWDHFHAPQGPYTLAVVRSEVSYKLPLRFNDSFEVGMYGYFRGARIVLSYELRGQVGDQQKALAQGLTELVTLNDKMQAIKPPEFLQEAIKKNIKEE